MLTHRHWPWPPAPIAALVLLLLAAGCQLERLGGETESVAHHSISAELYGRFCAACHGSDGRTVAGVTAPSIGNPAFLNVVGDDFLQKSIARGRPGRNAYGRRVNKMSAYGRAEGGPLDDEQIASLVRHVRAWQTTPAVTPQAVTAQGDAQRGRAVYGICAPCHGAEGWSLTAPSLAGSTFQEIATDAWIRHLVRHGRSDTQMNGFDIADPDMADLIAFIRQLDDPATLPPAQP